MTQIPRPALVALALLGLVLGAGPAQAQDGIAREIEGRISQLRSGGSLAVGRETLTSSPLLIAAYQENGFAPLWSDVATRGELVRLVEEIRDDGLEPNDYHYQSVSAPSTAGAAPGIAAELDLLRTAALIDLIHDLRVGRVPPDLTAIGSGLRAAAPELGGAELRSLIAPGRLHDAVLGYRPRHFVYVGLMAGLAELRRVAVEGGWEPLASGPPMMRDSADVRVAPLRRRLLREGYVLGQSGSADAFDAGLEAAVRTFQHRHGLNEDGVVGTVTLAELNVPVEARIAQVKINLERARWITHELPGSFLAVNTAGAKVYLVRGDSVAFETRAIVGKEYTKTPMFAADMRTIDLNPTWTVPSGIVGEVLGEIRRDPGYLERERIRVLDRKGTEVDPSTVRFARYSAKNFPYVFEGVPGPTNPLGRIKFLFPNEYAVYLHDTPSRELFARETRTFSHGCIRVEDPIRLAELLLDDPERWSRAAIEAAIEPGDTRTITLRKPLPVLVFYWTASADPDGEVHFYRDQYQRDPELLEALER